METDSGTNGKMASPNKRHHKDLPFVNKEFKKILEEYLSRRDYSVNRTKSELPPRPSRLRHQKILEVNVTEKKSFNRSDSYQKASLESIIDKDEDESENGLGRRSKTMPSGLKTELLTKTSKTKEISDAQAEELIRGRNKKERKKSEKDKGTKKSKRKTSVDEERDKDSHSLYAFDKHNGKNKSKPRTRSNSFSQKPGSESSENTDTDSLVSVGRKKKSFMKRTKERLALLLRKDKEKKERDIEDGYDRDDEDCHIYEKDKDKKRKPTKKGKSKKDTSSSAVIGAVHKHGKAHIKQSTDDVNHVILRTGEKWEEIDIEVGGKKKHIEQHIKLKESADDRSERKGSFIDNLKRPFGRKHSKKSLITESKSADFPSEPHSGRRDYSHSVSVPDDTKNKIHVKLKNTDSSPDKTVTHVFEESVDDICMNSQNGDSAVVDKRVEIDDFDDFFVSGGKAVIPKDGSFEMDVDYDVTEKYLQGGKVIRTVSAEESENRQNDLPDQPTNKKDAEGPKKALSEEEKEKIYERIAEKLTEIGDSYVQQLESEVDGVDSPVSPSEPMEISADGTVDERLNSLEQKLVFHLRGTGDKLAGQMSFPEDAAKEIVKEATYDKFKSTVKDAVGESVGQYQLAMFLHLTKTAVRVAGTGGAVATHIKEMSLRYFEDKFASWIVNQGGWESVLEDDDSELD